MYTYSSQSTVYLLFTKYCIHWILTCTTCSKHCTVSLYTGYNSLKSTGIWNTGSEVDFYIIQNKNKLQYICIFKGISMCHLQTYKYLNCSSSLGVVRLVWCRLSWTHVITFYRWHDNENIKSPKQWMMEKLYDIHNFWTYTMNI